MYDVKDITQVPVETLKEIWGLAHFRLPITI